MKTVVCNINKPSTQKIAAVTNHKFTNIHKTSNGWMCKLDGKPMKVTDARKKMLENVQLVNLHGFPCEV